MGSLHPAARRWLAILAASATATAGMAFLGSPALAETEDDYIVVLKDSAADVEDIAAEHQEEFDVDETSTYSEAISGYAGSMTPANAEQLGNDPAVAYVALDRQFTLAAQKTPVSVTRTGADQSSAKAGDGTGSVDVNIAVIDTGVDATHPDLNVRGGVDCSSGSAVNVPAPVDVMGHGTSVAGVAAARDNDLGVVGMAPGAPIWSVRVLSDAGTISESSLICAYDWVTQTRTDNNADNDIAVANVSIAGPGTDDGACGSQSGDPMHAAICRSVEAGVTYVVAAGNGATDVAGVVPAAYDEVLTATAIGDFDGRPGGEASPVCLGQDVSAYANDDRPASFSNFATQGDDLEHTVAGPGVCVETTARGGGIASPHGTSFSSPAVAGTVALCLNRGTCTGSVSDVVDRFVEATEEYNNDNPDHGYEGDPQRPGSIYYGHLIRGSVF